MGDGRAIQKPVWSRNPDDVAVTLAVETLATVLSQPSALGPASRLHSPVRNFGRCWSRRARAAAPGSPPKTAVYGQFSTVAASQWDAAIWPRQSDAIASSYPPMFGGNGAAGVPDLDHLAGVAANRHQRLRDRRLGVGNRCVGRVCVGVAACEPRFESRQARPAGVKPQSALPTDNTAKS